MAVVTEQTYTEQTYIEWHEIQFQKNDQTVLISRLTEAGQLLRISPKFELYAQVSMSKQGAFVSLHWKDTQDSAVYFAVKADDPKIGLEFNEEINVVHSSGKTCYQMKKSSFPGRTLVLPFLLSENAIIRVNQIKNYRLVETKTNRWGMTLLS